MRIRTTLSATILLLSLAALTFGHGDKVHVLGTVARVSDSSITVKTSDGKFTEVKLVASTVYILHSIKADQPAKAADIAVGDLVVIHATPRKETLEADEVKFSVPAKGAATKSRRLLPQLIQTSARCGVSAAEPASLPLRSVTMCSPSKRASLRLWVT